MAVEIVQRIVDYVSSYDGEKKEMLIIPITENATRRKVHEVLETLAPWVGKTSLKSDYFPNYSVQNCLQCRVCNNGKWWTAKCRETVYCRSYRAVCGDCGRYYVWDEGYDDKYDMLRVYRKNCIVLGKCLRAYNNKHATIRLKDRKKMLEEKRHLQLDREAMYRQLVPIFEQTERWGYETPVSVMQDFPDYCASRSYVELKLGELLQKTHVRRVQ